MPDCNSSFFICRLATTLEHKLQCELHDSWIACRAFRSGQNSAEVCNIRQHEVRITKVHMVRDIKGLGAEFHRLPFSNSEGPRNSHVELHTCRTSDRSRRDISI